MNVMLMQHLLVAEHSEEINEVNLAAIDLAPPLLIKTPLRTACSMITHQGHIPFGQGYVAHETAANVSGVNVIQML